MLIKEFDIWREGYNDATVIVYVAGTTSLANVYSDEGMTVPASNPQTLISKQDDSGNYYGRFLESIYTDQPYFLNINTSEETGITRPPLTSLVGEDASDASVTIDGSSVANDLKDIVARTIHAENYGQIIVGGYAGSAATNTSTIAAAIGALGGSGSVQLPAGLIRFNQLSLSAGVVLVGTGENATTLQSIIGDKSITITGSGAGLKDLTLDGNSLTASSVGIYGENVSNTVFNNVTVKNFETGIHLKGGALHDWRKLTIDNCVDGALLNGDATYEFLGGRWYGGSAQNCTTSGVTLEYVDAICSGMSFNEVLFKDNTGTAIIGVGCRSIPFNHCRWTGNTTNIDLNDDTAILTPSTQYQNTVSAINVIGGQISGGEVKVSGVADDIVFDHVELLGVTFNAVVPIIGNILLKDCYEDGLTTLSGDTTKTVRKFDGDTYEVSGITTGATLTRALGIVLEPGQVAYLEMNVVGRQRNGTNKAIYHTACGVFRAGSALAYINQTANFTVGDIITGATSGATARLQADADGGATGTLTLIDIKGAFVNGEIITGSTTGSATTSGTLVAGAHSLDSVGLVLIRAVYETDATWNVTYTASASEIAFNVQGAASQTVDWIVRVKKLVV